MHNLTENYTLDELLINAWRVKAWKYEVKSVIYLRKYKTPLDLVYYSIVV